MLPGVLPASRTIGFGFDLSSVDAAIDFDSAASTLFKALLATRGPDSGRPLVFIGHGYGTVIIQSLLSTVKGDADSWLNLRGCTAAVVLFAPPFRGSDEFIEWNMKSSKLQDSMKKILEPHLGNGSQYLQKYWKDFRVVAQNPNIFVFAYLSKSANVTEKSRKADKVKASKTLSIEDLKRDVDLVDVSPTEDMWDIAKFSGPNDPRLHSIAGLISKKVQT